MLLVLSLWVLAACGGNDATPEATQQPTEAVAATPLVQETLPAVVEALQAGFDLPMRPMEEGRYYYMAQIEVETLSLTDLDELQRWLRGDLGPAVRGERAPGTAVGRGMHRVLVRMLGIPARRFRVRSEAFVFEARDPG